MISDEEGFAVWSGQARFYAGWVRALSGDPEGGLLAMKEGWDAFRRTGADVQATQWWLMQAEALRAAGRAEDAQSALAHGMRHAERSAERAFEPELHRVQGELLAEGGSPERGEVCLRRSLELARKQRAKMLELRTCLALGRLLDARGQRAEARALLEGVHGSFPESAEIEELGQARRLIEEWR